MSDEIIDISDYLTERERIPTFSVVGGEGERSRLALPVWRAVHILGGDRGGVVWSAREGGAPRALFVLDLASEPARTGFESEGIERLKNADPPAMDTAEGIVTVLLARTDRRSWYLVVVGRDVGVEDLESRGREDLLFLAGECAGLVLHGNLEA